MKKVTLGGDRLGVGQKTDVALHDYGTSTHDLSEVWRSTMAPGTLVPFVTKIMLPGSKVKMKFKTKVLTLPTIGPLFGSMKLQMDLFWTPARLYNGMLHMDAYELGYDMTAAKIPQIRMTAFPPPTEVSDKNTFQINPSSLLSYLGMRGIGVTLDEDGTTRDFNALLILMYWDAYYQYYANQQEGIGAVIHTTQNTTNTETVTEIYAIDLDNGGNEIGLYPTTIPGRAMMDGYKIQIYFTGTEPDPKQVMFRLDTNEYVSAFDLCGGNIGLLNAVTDVIEGVYLYSRYGARVITSWRYRTNADAISVTPEISTFPLSNIMDMKKAILQHATTDPFLINTPDIEPYNYLHGYNATTKVNNVAFEQEGLGLKTYLSDMYHNWLDTARITAINLIASVSTAGNTFTMDTLALTKKVWEILNRVAVSGGRYSDWIEAVYAESMMRQVWSPVFMGGMSEEIVFQEIENTSEQPGQPLGTVAGRGRDSGQTKGGEVSFTVDEPGFLMGIVSITPRIDYSQGNEWFTQLQTWNDFHKPGLDGIGFRDLITEELAWWATHHNTITWITTSAGKQPAWQRYQTSVNKTFGNFAIENNQMYMTLNRRYEPDESYDIIDLTSYIDPVKFNQIFAETSIGAQNFWIQIASDIMMTHKMSAMVMPML